MMITYSPVLPDRVLWCSCVLTLDLHLPSCMSLKQKRLSIHVSTGGVCGSWLTPRTLDLEVRGSSLAHRIDSSDRELYSTLSIFAQVYKWVPKVYCRGGGGEVTLQWTSILSRQGGVAILLGMLHAKETWISSSHLDFWLVSAFTIYYKFSITLGLAIYLLVSTNLLIFVASSFITFKGMWWLIFPLQRKKII